MCLIFIILLFTNLLSIVFTGAVTYFITKDQDTQTKVPKVVMTPSSLGLTQTVSGLKDSTTEETPLLKLFVRGKL